MPEKKLLEPLSPLEDLKKVVAGLARVPKDTIKVKPERPKPRKKSRALRVS